MLAVRPNLTLTLNLTLALILTLILTPNPNQNPNPNPNHVGTAEPVLGASRRLGHREQPAHQRGPAAEEQRYVNVGTCLHLPLPLSVLKLAQRRPLLHKV